MLRTLSTLMRIRGCGSSLLVDADPDPACHPNADADPDTDPGSQNDADPDPGHFFLSLYLTFEEENYLKML
jgi:hypothetical protein